jgi:hypothetical protein
MKVKIFLVAIVTAASVFGIVVAASNNAVSSSTMLSGKQETVSGSSDDDSTQQISERPGAIDGAKNPDLIPNNVAYSILFRLIGDRKTPEEKSRVKSYIRDVLDIGCKSCHLLRENGKITNAALPDRTAEQEEADIDAMIATIDEFSQEVALFDNQAKYIKNHRRDNPQAAAQLTVLQAQKNALVEGKSVALINRLGLVSRGKLQSFVSEKLKPKIKISPALSIAAAQSAASAQ